MTEMTIADSIRRDRAGLEPYRDDPDPALEMLRKKVHPHG